MRITITYPAWLEREPNFCLYSIAEDMYIAKAWADKFHAKNNPNYKNIYQAGMKSLVKLEDRSLSNHVRCREGDRAANKFWEIKNIVDDQ